jgi:hypothetical protein
MVIRKSGYCNLCLKNVPHTLRLSMLRALDRFAFGLFSLLRLGSWYCEGCEKRSTFLPAYRKGVSEFYGIENPDEKAKRQKIRKQKEARHKHLQKQKEKQHSAEPALNSDSEITRVDKAELLSGPHRKRRGSNPSEKPKTDDQSLNDTVRETAPQEPIGNVLRTDESLLVRKARASRFTEKFRDSVVKRILSGQATIGQMRHELKLSERDLLDWIAESNREKDDRIIELNQTINSLKNIGWDGQFADSTLHAPHGKPTGSTHDPTSVEDSSVVEGRVNPK